MISRRIMALGLAAAAPSILRISKALGQDDEAKAESFVQLIYPPLEALSQPENFGYLEPDQAQKDKVDRIINETPKGPTPLAIARSFIDRFATSDPGAISQWPAPDSWNPLIVRFFQSTSMNVANDMVAWCAAFANWCIERNNKTGTRSASSQSFVDPRNAKYFPRTNDPQQGDLAVWTCYDAQSGNSLNLGHVAFVSDKPSGNSVLTISGNTSRDNHYSIIAEKPFATKDREVYRTVNGARVPTVMKLNAYLKIA